MRTPTCTCRTAAPRSRAEIWKRATWYAERRDATRYGPKQEVTMNDKKVIVHIHRERRTPTDGHPPPNFGRVSQIAFPCPQTPTVCGTNHIQGTLVVVIAFRNF